MRSANRRRAAWLVACLLLLGGLAFASVVRVPARMLGIRPHAVLAPGWHARPPFATIRLVPTSGHLERLDVERTSPEGSRLVVRLTLDYRLDAERPPDRNDRLFESGVEGLVADLARPVLDALPPADRQGPAGGPPAPLTAGARDALARALAAGGVTSGNLAALSGVQAAAGAVGTGELPRRDATGIRLLLIGLDGADWKTIDPLLRAGRLPRLERLIRDGVRAPLRSYDPMISPLLWTT